MAQSSYRNMPQKLALWRNSLENTENTPTIKATMEEFGYPPEELETGKQKLTTAAELYDFKKTQDDEKSEAYTLYSNKRDELENTFRNHRKRAKVVFKRDLTVLDKLHIQDGVPDGLAELISVAGFFYDAIASDTELLNKLNRLKITTETVTAAKTLINETETGYFDYLRERGEAEDAKPERDNAFQEISEWMADFYDVAEIALEDNPQLLEALGVRVRS